MHSISLFKRIACVLYESILVFAILFVAGIIYRAIFGDPISDLQRNTFFIYSWTVAGAYFVFCWAKSGQTLAMQTWRIQLTSQDGSRLTALQAVQRYILASLFFGVSFLWAIFDRDGLYLHDRFTGGRLIAVPKSSKAK